VSVWTCVVRVGQPVSRDGQGKWTATTVDSTRPCDSSNPCPCPIRCKACIPRLPLHVRHPYRPALVTVSVGAIVRAPDDHLALRQRARRPVALARAALALRANQTVPARAAEDDARSGLPHDVTEHGRVHRTAAVAAAAGAPQSRRRTEESLAAAAAKGCCPAAELRELPPLAATGCRSAPPRGAPRPAAQPCIFQWHALTLPAAEGVRRARCAGASDKQEGQPPHAQCRRPRR